MRDTFVKTLVDLAKEDKNIELVTGDLGFGVLKPFWETVPDQFTNAGIAEQNMTTVAAGMALEGKTVFTYSIGNFPTLRCLEQIRNDCAYHNANVKVVCIGGGFVYGSLGMSHQATEDLAILRALPDVVVMAPADLVEAEECTKALAAYPGTAYLRLGRGGEKRIHDHIENFQIGKAIKVKSGEKIAIFSTGAIFEDVYKRQPYDSRHLLRSFDFTDKEVYQQYLYRIFAIRDMNASIDTATEVGTDDKILTLSTCYANQPDMRFLVQAVLVSIEQ